MENAGLHTNKPRDDRSPLAIAMHSSTKRVLSHKPAKKKEIHKVTAETRLAKVPGNIEKTVPARQEGGTHQQARVQDQRCSIERLAQEVHLRSIEPVPFSRQEVAKFPLKQNSRTNHGGLAQEVMCHTTTRGTCAQS